jgi:hypothetical protein
MFVINAEVEHLTVPNSMGKLLYIVLAKIFSGTNGLAYCLDHQWCGKSYIALPAGPYS